MFKKVKRHPLSTLFDRRKPESIDQLHLFGHSHLLITFKNFNEYCVLHIPSQLTQTVTYFSKRTRIAASFPYVVSLHECDTANESSSENQKTSEIVVFDVLGGLKKTFLLWAVLESKEVTGLYCSEDWIVVATHEELFKCNYLDLRLQEIKLNSKIKLLPGLKSQRSMLKQNKLLLISKNNKHFQLWNIETGECLIEQTLSDNIVIVAMDHIVPQSPKLPFSKGSKDQKRATSSPPPFPPLMTGGIPIPVVVMSTKSKLLVWVVDLSETFSYDIKFISAIFILGDFIIVGDVTEGVTLIRLFSKKTQPLNYVKPKDEDDLGRMSAGVFSIQMLGDFVICGTNNGVKVWNLKLTNQTRPVGKFKVSSNVVQIYVSQTCRTINFSLKKDSVFTEVISWNPPIEVVESMPSKKFPLMMAKPLSEEKDKFATIQYYSDTTESGTHEDSVVENYSFENSEDQTHGKIFSITPFRSKLSESPNLPRSVPINYSLTEEGTTDRSETRKRISETKDANRVRRNSYFTQSDEESGVGSTSSVNGTPMKKKDSLDASETSKTEEIYDVTVKKRDKKL